ncbi:uncharacterized protein LOC116003860 [Ipomoea triloba]|uniref:uncharacterized protein LOC116003860 n=1 Tax=Ipomoea triloba TaxID=35885 RepID=UPI00125CD835|nr:uncharacterized protein LOC116003860 [Ipomoea triloba]
MDDILVMGSDPDLITNLLSKLSTAFKIWDLGEPDFFLGIETIINDDDMVLSQQRYMTDILKRAGMAEFKALFTHIPISKSIPFSTDLYEDLTQYRSMAGALQYLTITRSDLSFAKKQRNVARSSTEAEYKALAYVCVEVIWVLPLLKEISVLGIPVSKLWCDNLGATYMCANPIFHARTKYVEIDYHFVRDRVANGEI